MKRLRLQSMQVPLRADADGVVRVEPTRITLDTVIAAYRTGCTAEEIVEQYPTLPLSNIHAAIAYYLTNRQEVDAYLAAREAEGAQLRRDVESVCEQRGVRERLLAREAARRAGR